MKVVHLCRPEKFMPLMRSVFEEAFPGCNRHVEVLARRPQPSGAAPLPPGLVQRSSRTFRSPAIAADLQGADLIVAHSMTTDFARALAQAPPSARVAWIGWGYDYVRLLAGSEQNLLLPATAALEARLQAGNGLGRWLQPLRALGRRLEQWHRRLPPVASVAGRIDVFSCNPGEVDALRQALPALRGVYRVVPSFTVEDVFDRGPARMQGPDVLLGNSATATNNHLEALALVAPRVPAGGRVVTPLNYGSAAYADAVMQAGQALLPGCFDGLRAWMPIDDYNARIARCGFVVMNHRRQQAVGNISAALYKGATVYLRRENPLWGFYATLGVTLRAVDDLEADPQRPLEPLPDDIRASNCEAVAARYRRSAVVAAARALATCPRRDRL